MKRKMIEKIEKTLMYACVFALCISVWYWRKCSDKGVIDSQPQVKVDTLIVEHIDTITLEHTITKYKPQPIKTDTIYIQSETTPDLTEQHIRNVYKVDGSQEDTTCNPSARVNYQISVATMDNGIDSIGVHFKVDYPRVVKTQTITKEVTKYKNKHFTYGIQTGVGYGLINKKPDLYVGFGIQYNF